MKYGIITVFLVLFCTMTIPAHAIYATGCKKTNQNCTIYDSTDASGSATTCAECKAEDNKGVSYTGKYCAKKSSGLNETQIEAKALEKAEAACKAAKRPISTPVPANNSLPVR